MCQELHGTVERFLFSNAENGYSVFEVKLASHEKVVVRGITPPLQAGQVVTLTGAWVLHPKFGQQFEVQGCSIELPTSIAGLKRYLGSGLIKGIGAVYAEKIVDRFGVNVLAIIDEYPERLAEVPGIGPKRHETIIKAWQDQKQIAKIMAFLCERGVSTAFALKIYKKYGQDSIPLITQNPYRLAYEIWGVGFKSADTLAQQMGFTERSIQRIEAGIVFVITEHNGAGHVYVELEALKKDVRVALGFGEDDEEIGMLLKQALHHLYDVGT